jgi:cytochrome c oxidase accessory protein FixG
MLFDFGFFREQTCLVACPYGRLQSVLLDRDSLIISYDRGRGEPRGHKRRAGRGGGEVSLPVLGEAGGGEPGDCIDCFKCVTTCPTGIDIRNGLQMECVHCTQCIDACDEVMDRIGRPRGLIRYSSQARIEGERPRLLRPRVIVYPLLLGLLLAGLVGVAASKREAEFTLIRARGGAPYFQASGPDGGALVGSRLTARVRNRTGSPVTYTFAAIEPAGVRVSGAEEGLEVPGFGLETAPIVVLVPAEAFGPRGGVELRLRVEGSDGFVGERRFPLIGPAWTGAEPSGGP